MYCYAISIRFSFSIYKTNIANFFKSSDFSLPGQSTYAALMSERPNQTSSRPNAKLNPTYNPKLSHCRCCRSRYMSSENDEKVVNPPQKPVMRKTFIDGETRCVFSARPKKMPMMKLPTRLTVKVPHGKAAAPAK